MNKNSLANFKILKADMELKGWVIDSFIFRYKNQTYIVLVKLYVTDEIRPQYALLKVEFFEEYNINANLEVPANSNGLMVDAQRLREYFGIEYNQNLGDILQEFNEHLGKSIPTEVVENKSDTEKTAIERSLSTSDAEDPNKKYCTKVKRNGSKQNGELKHRSPYNDNITRIRRSELYRKLSGDTNISFCYSFNATDEKTDEEIILNWTRNNV